MMQMGRETRFFFLLLFCWLATVEDTSCAKWSSLLSGVDDGMTVVVVGMQALLCRGDGSVVLFFCWRVLPLLKLQLMPMS